MNPVVRTAALLVLAFAVLLGLLVACGELLHLAEGPDGSTGFDSSITSWMVDHRTAALTSIARFFSTVGSQVVLTPLALAAAVALLLRRQIGAAGAVLVIWSAAIGLYSLAKELVGRPRPPAEFWLTRAGGKAFPSGHAVQSLSTYVVLALVCALWFPRARRPLVAAAALLALGVGWSRVYLGVHWSTDVLFGWLAAAAWVTAAAWAMGPVLSTPARPPSPL